MLWSVQFVVLTVLLCITVGLFGPGSFCTDVNDPACFSSANSTLHGDAECAYLSTCSLSEIEQSMSIASACWVLLVLAIYFVMLFVSYRWLKYEPYHAYRTSWIELGVQVRLFDKAVRHVCSTLCASSLYASTLIINPLLLLLPDAYSAADGRVHVAGLFASMASFREQMRVK